VKEHEAGESAGGGTTKADRRASEAEIAGLERKVGQPTMALGLLEKGLISARRARGGTSARRRERPWACGVRAGCRAMSPAPSTHRHRAKAKPAGAVGEEARLVAHIREICAGSPRYGYRRATRQREAEGERVNHKRVARIMREQDLRGYRRSGALP
jgi:hypothetical protein